MLKKIDQWLGGALVLSELGWAVPKDWVVLLQFEVVLLTSYVMLTITVQIKLLQNGIEGCAETREAVAAKV